MRTRLIPPVLAVICAALPGFAQTTLNWEQVKARFETANPTLQAGQLSIAESKTLETTAFLRPNPNMTVSADQFDPFPANPYRPFGSMMPYVAFDYLHERQHSSRSRDRGHHAGAAGGGANHGGGCGRGRFFAGDRHRKGERHQPEAAPRRRSGRPGS